MSEKVDYKDYVQNKEHMNQYSAYQSRYTDEPRESDKVLMQLIENHSDVTQASLLDIGCSTGNLLRHIQAQFPKMALTGADAEENVIAQCSGDEALQGIDFTTLDIVAGPAARTYDVIVMNAVAGSFRDPEFEQSMAHIASSLNAKGSLMLFDWMHPFEQHVEIVERSSGIPDGLLWNCRPYKYVSRVLEELSFLDITFQPFYMPIDLPKPDCDSVSSYTVVGPDGNRMSFRGCIHQPWCHVIAQLA